MTRIEDLRDPVRLSALFGAMALGVLPAGCLFYGDPCHMEKFELPAQGLEADKSEALVSHCGKYCASDTRRTLSGCALVVGTTTHEMTCRYAPTTPDAPLTPSEQTVAIASVALPEGRTDGPAYCATLCKTEPGKKVTADPCRLDSDAGVFCTGERGVCQGVGRRPRRGRAAPGAARSAPGSPAVAAHFTAMSALERASVDAFEELARDLDALGAPLELRRSARRAADDERRHTRITAWVARSFGATGAPAARGGVRANPPKRLRPTGEASLERIARENVREGCVREAFGALVATYQANAARDPRVAGAMVEIAADETRHAALSFSIHAWALPLLSAPARRRVRAAERRAFARLEREIGAGGVVDATLAAVGGCPDRAATLALVRAFRERLASSPQVRRST